MTPISANSFNQYKDGCMQYFQWSFLPFLLLNLLFLSAHYQINRTAKNGTESFGWLRTAFSDSAFASNGGQFSNGTDEASASTTKKISVHFAPLRHFLFAPSAFMRRDGLCHCLASFVFYDIIRTCYADSGGWLLTDLWVGARSVAPEIFCFGFFGLGPSRSFAVPT